MGNAIPAAEVEVPSAVTAAPAVMATRRESGSLVRATWERWKKMAHAVGVVQTRLLMILFFFAFAFPLGLAMRMTGDRLGLKPPGGTNWSPHQHQEQNLDSARRQY